MSAKRSTLSLLALLTASTAIAQVAPAPAGAIVFPDASLVSAAPWFTVQTARPEGGQVAGQDDAVQLLRSFKDSDIKFNLDTMMATLRDHRHEGWVLAVYPDPNTRRPLIGAGFSLDVPARVHPQSDPLNPRPFVEPSSLQLWQAAGLAPERLQQILDQYDRNMNDWSAKTYRHKILRRTLTSQLTEEEGQQLLRISAIQAIYNAQAYCRYFDQLSGSQQMALSQLVFQMGVNLEQFVSFLGVLNDPYGTRSLARLDGYLETGPEHWQAVQTALVDSQWARRYSVRAAAVIAMFDPAYGQAPASAEMRVLAMLQPPVEVPRSNIGAATLHLASFTRRSGKVRGKRVSRHPVKRRLT